MYTDDDLFRFARTKQAQVSSLSLEKQRLSSELDERKQSENANKNTAGKRIRRHVYLCRRAGLAVWQGSLFSVAEIVARDLNNVLDLEGRPSNR